MRIIYIPDGVVWYNTLYSGFNPFQYNVNERLCQYERCIKRCCNNIDTILCILAALH